MSGFAESCETSGFRRVRVVKNSGTEEKGPKLRRTDQHGQE